MFRSVLLLVILSIAAPPLQAQQQQGDTELQLTGSLLSTSGQDDISISLGIVQAKVGYFITDHIEIGGFPSLTFTRTTFPINDQPNAPRARVSESRVGMGVFATYSFLMDDAKTVPYLGVQFYKIDLADSDETGWAGVNGGLKFFMSERTAFDLGGNALMGLGEDGGALLLFQFGLSFFL